MISSLTKNRGRTGRVFRLPRNPIYVVKVLVLARSTFNGNPLIIANDFLEVLK